MTRSEALPDVPAVSEFVTGYDARVWSALGAPRNTPTGIIGHPYQGSVLYNYDDTISTLPSLDTTLDSKHGDAALAQLVEAFRKLPPTVVVAR